MPCRLFRPFFLLLALSVLPGCIVSSVHVNPAPPAATTRLLPADPEATWAALLRVVEAKNVPILGMAKERGWLQTDYVYFRPMDFDVPVLDGTMLMGAYLDVKGGRYRLSVRISGEASGTSVRIDTQLQRLEERRNATSPAEPSYSLDAPVRRGYLVSIAQPSNGVIEARILDELEAVLSGRADGGSIDQNASRGANSIANDIANDIE